MAQPKQKRFSFSIESILGPTEARPESNISHFQDKTSNWDKREETFPSLNEQKRKSLGKPREQSSGQDNTPSLESVQRLRQRKRNLFSPRQVRELVKCFRRKQYLGAFERESLARKIELSPKQVMIWFQNYRYKHRRLQKLGISKDKLDKDIFDETVSSTELDHHGRNFFAGSDMSIDRNSVGVVHSQNVRVPLQSEVTLSLSDFSLLLASSLMYPSVLGFGSAQVPRQWEGLPNTQ